MYFQFGFFILFYDSHVHEKHYGIFVLGNNYFIRKRCWYITFTCQWVDMVRSVWMTLTDPSSWQIYHSIVSLDALLCLFSYEVVCVGFLSAIVYLFFFLLFFAFQRKYTFILFHLDLLISVFYFLLIIIVLDPIIKVLVIFNLVLKLQFVIYFFNSILVLFDFWFFFLVLLLKFCWFSIPFLIKVYVFYCFQFSPHYFDLFFLLLKFNCF